MGRTGEAGFLVIVTEGVSMGKRRGRGRESLVTATRKVVGKRAFKNIIHYETDISTGGVLFPVIGVIVVAVVILMAVGIISYTWVSVLTSSELWDGMAKVAANNPFAKMFYKICDIDIGLVAAFVLAVRSLRVGVGKRPTADSGDDLPDHLSCVASGPGGDEG